MVHKCIAHLSRSSGIFNLLHGVAFSLPSAATLIINQRAYYLNKNTLMEEEQTDRPKLIESSSQEDLNEEEQGVGLFEGFVDEPQPQFPDDLGPEPVEEAQEDDGDATISNQFFNQVIREQEEFIDSLNQAENQLMLDEAFILMISSVCNKKTDEFYSYDHRDDAHLSMVRWF